MLKEFWREKGHILQMTGILTGVGALFLAVPIPENTKAQLALQDLKFIWLVIISGAAILLMLQLWIFFRVFEKQLKKDGFDIEETLSIIAMVGIGYFVFNLWQYATALYSDTFFRFVGIAGYGIGALFGALGIQFWKWSVSKVQNANRFIYICVSLSSMLAFSSVFMAWILFTTHRGWFPLESWLKYTLIFLVAIIILMFAVEGYRKRIK